MHRFPLHLFSLSLSPSSLLLCFPSLLLLYCLPSSVFAYVALSLPSHPSHPLTLSPSHFPASGSYSPSFTMYVLRCSLIFSSSFLCTLYSSFIPTIFPYTILSPSKCMHSDSSCIPLSSSCFFFYMTLPHLPLSLISIYCHTGTYLSSSLHMRSLTKNVQTTSFVFIDKFLSSSYSYYYYHHHYCIYCQTLLLGE